MTMRIVMDTGMLMTIIAAVVLLAGAMLALPPIRQLLKKRTNDADYAVLMELTETGVRWARQWMYTATGEAKKEEVATYLREKATALGMNVDEDDIDKAIEAVYDRIRQEIDIETDV